MPYIPFDRKEAEARAAKLRKEHERARREAEEREIWKELVEEQIQAERGRTTVLIEKPRPAQEKPNRHYRGRSALEQFIAEIDRLADGEIALLRCGGRILLWAKRRLEMGRMSTSLHP